MKQNKKSKRKLKRPKNLQKIKLRKEKKLNCKRKIIHNNNSDNIIKIK